MVQHPSLGAPFLSGATVVHCNGKRGFAQGDNTNTCAAVPESPTFEFPATINRAGQPADARRMTGGDDDVISGRGEARGNFAANPTCRSCHDGDRAASMLRRAASSEDASPRRAITAREISQ